MYYKLHSRQRCGKLNLTKTRNECFSRSRSRASPPMQRHASRSSFNLSDSQLYFVSFAVPPPLAPLAASVTPQSLSSRHLGLDCHPVFKKPTETKKSAPYDPAGFRKNRSNSVKFGENRSKSI
jgi:hypothetical protein